MNEETVRDLIMPLGIMFLFGFLGDLGIARGGNPFILGVFLMYLSYVVVYFTLLHPILKNTYNKEKTK